MREIVRSHDDAQRAPSIEGFVANLVVSGAACATNQLTRPSSSRRQRAPWADGTADPAGPLRSPKRDEGNRPLAR